MRKIIQLFILIILLTACSSSDDNSDNGIDDPTTGMYFPPITGNIWETTTAESLNWDTQKINELYTFLEQNETRAFIVLINGRIVLENYWNNDLLGQPFDASKQWYWASAGKSLTASLIGIAQENGHLDINDKTSDYLGTGWTNMPQNKEDLITIKNHLTLTTGIDYNVSDLDCTLPTCLDYLADAGTQWYYHNATYTLLHHILENASGMTNNEFTEAMVEDKIGMDGLWVNTNGYNEIFFSDARSAARYGLLTLNEGNWDGTTVLGDNTYYNEMTNTSQSLNPSYGYLWWLNGKSSTVFPTSPASFPVSVAPQAPSDMIMALGKDGQFIDVVPSKNMVLIRLGDNSDNQPVPFLFHNELWEKMNEVMGD